MMNGGFFCFQQHKLSGFSWRHTRPDCLICDFHVCCHWLLCMVEIIAQSLPRVHTRRHPGFTPFRPAWFGSKMLSALARVVQGCLVDFESYSIPHLRRRSEE